MCCGKMLGTAPDKSLAFMLQDGEAEGPGYWHKQKIGVRAEIGFGTSRLHGLGVKVLRAGSREGHTMLQDVSTELELRVARRSVASTSPLNDRHFAMPFLYVDIVQTRRLLYLG